MVEHGTEKQIHQSFREPGPKKKLKMEFKQFLRYDLRFLWKEARLSQNVIIVGSSFQMMGAATENPRLPRPVQFCSGNTKLL